METGKMEFNQYLQAVQAIEDHILDKQEERKEILQDIFKDRSIILFLDSKAKKITYDDGNNEISLSVARWAWENGKVADCSQSFKRLAAHHDFDIDSLNAWYEEVDGKL